VRSLLAAVAVLLAGSVIWILARPAAEPDPAASPAQPATAFQDHRAPALTAPETPADPDLTRTAVASEAERKRAALESVPHTSLRVRIRDAYDVLATPCTVSLEVRLPNGRRATGERTVDSQGECWFEILPAGDCELSLIRQPAPGLDWWRVCTKSFALIAGEPALQLVNLDEELVLVELQCSNPPRGGLEEVDLGEHAEWTSEDPGAGVFPGSLTALVSVGAELEASFRSLDEEYRETRRFLEPGRQVWTVELPAGELQLTWRPTGGLDKFILESDPTMPRGWIVASCFSDHGRGSFAWLEPGRYLVRAGTIVGGVFHEKARSSVEVGAQMTELTLESSPTSTLRFTLPDFPGEEREQVGAQSRGTKTVASLVAAGQQWPVHGTKSCASQEDWHFASVLAGEYDLVVRHRSWASITRVIVSGNESETFVAARPWVGFVNVRLFLRLRPGQSPPERVELASAEGVTLELSKGNEWFQDGGKFRGFLASRVPSGPAKLTVTFENGVRTEMDLVISTEEWSEHVIELP